MGELRPPGPRLQRGPGHQPNRDDNSEAFDTHPDCREGFAEDIEEGDTLNVVNRGAAVDMFFDAGPHRGIDILASNSPYSRQVDCQTLATVTPGQANITPRPLPIPAENPGKSKFSFNQARGLYRFPWKILNEWGGTCREFVLTRDDGVQHRAYFRIQARPPLELTGQVRGAGGEPVANARVALRGDNFYSTTTDADGFYSLQDLPSGTYEATVSAVCYEPQTQTVDLSQSRTVNFTLAKQSDAFGHTCAPEATPFEQADTLVPLTGDDIATTIDLPFPFTFYGETYNRAHLCTNGFMEFVGPTTTNCSGFNAAIPTAARPNGQIAAFWDDLVIDAEASIRADARGSAPDRRFVVEFRNVQFFNDATRRVDFNIVLFENGEILTQYRNIANDGRERGNSATIGIENQTGTDALRLSLNEAALASEPTTTSVRYTSSPPGQSQAVTRQ